MATSFVSSMIFGTTGKGAFRPVLTLGSGELRYRNVELAVPASG
jgi:hypothetical protein